MNEAVENMEMPSVGYSTPRDTYGSSILMLTNPDNSLYKMELAFRSCVEDLDGNVVQKGAPLMNDEGITKVIGQVQTIVNQVTVMSHLDKKNILMLMEDLADSLAIDLMMNRKRYNIVNPSARNVVYAEALRSAFICMTRALQGGERRFWKGTQHEITNRMENQQQQGGGLMRWLNWKR
jgi:hypothetical protein